MPRARNTPKHTQWHLRLSFGLAALLLAVGIAVRPTPALVAAPPWPESPYIRSQIEQVLPEVGPDWDGRGLAYQDSRSAVYKAAGLLWRDGPHDRAAAESILRGVLEMQYDDPEQPSRYGVWKLRQGATDIDPNWREFVGCGLILILETLGDRLSEDLIRDTDAALLRAAEGSQQRDVGAGYTNIALMSAFFLQYVGARRDRDDLAEAGAAKAEAIYARFSRHKTFDEYNSPTYNGVNLMALAMWRRFAPQQRMRDLGRVMEAELWRDIARFYHAGMRNLVGPFYRSYGMDMTRYNALLGLWIALVVDDPELAPWPASGGNHRGDRVYAPVFALLGTQVPEDVRPHLQAFQGPRTFARQFQDTQAVVRIESTWMMGAANLQRRWEQLHPATVYWLPETGGAVGWILLPGTNHRVVPKVVDRSLELRRLQPSPEPIEWLLWAPGVEASDISADRWDLPGLTARLELAGGVTLQTVTPIHHRHYDRCLELRYRVPQDHAGAVPLITLHLEEVP